MPLRHNFRLNFTTRTPGSMDHTDPTTTLINAGLIKRNNIAKGSALLMPMSSSYLAFAERGQSQTETVPVQECIPHDDRGEDNKIQSDHHRCPAESGYGRCIRRPTGNLEENAFNFESRQYKNRGTYSWKSDSPQTSQSPLT